MELHERSEAIENQAQDLPLNEEVAQAAENVTENPVTKESLLAALAELCEKPETEVSTDEITRIKQQFYSLHNEEVRAAKAAFVEAGNDEAAFEAATDESEQRFKEMLNTLKERKAARRAEIEAEQQSNLEKKRAIVDELMAMSADTDNVNRHYQRAKDLQNDFKTIGEVPPEQATDLWKAYQDAVERFYDQWKVNKELRDYDFKKNLAEKNLLIAEAQKLTEEADVITAFRRLQELHDKWREIGPVAKELRDEIWSQFKDASATINKRYQTFFEERKNRERENENAKTAICERVEALDFSTLTTYSAWDKMTRTIIGEQEEWKKLGYASRKMNNALFARFRAVCDDFFARKAEFYANIKKEFADNLAKKTALCERAEALKDSTDWKKTAEEIAALQKEWKTIGSVAKKHSDAIWKRFGEACDYFFERKKKDASGTRKTEQANLKVKNDIIRQLQELNSPEAAVSRDEAVKTVQQLRSLWQSTGHVPFREKDKLYESYREVVGQLYDKYDIRENRARMASFESDINTIEGDENKLYRERDRLTRLFEQRKTELQTYENNLGFFNSKSKSGDSMLREMERKMQRIKEEIAELAKKIELIDSKL